MVKGSQTAGVKPMSISGRLNSDRERLLGMTDEERAFRKQWLKDQQLSPNEPRHVPEIYKATHNPIRRLYRWPLDTLFKIMEPTLGVERAKNWRYFTGKFGLAIVSAYIITYYFKYNANDWTRAGGWKLYKSRPAIVPGDVGFPAAGLSDRKFGADYAHRGFKDASELNL